MQFGTVSIVGRSNVGKSTFLNAVLGEQLAIVAPVPQTTRDTLLGVVTVGAAQIAFVDTPGVHRPRSELGRRMNTAALDAARGAEVIVFMTDVAGASRLATRSGDADRDLAQDLDLARKLPARVPTVAVINKIDLLKNKSLLLPMIETLGDAAQFSAFVPVSVLEGDGVERILEEIVRLLPDGDHVYSADTLTDRPVVFFVREYVREQAMLHLEREVPHAVAVSVDRFEETERLVTVNATLHVEKPGQRAIVVGEGGARIREIGTQARKRLEELLGRKVYLELFVRVSPRWRNIPRQLAELGYDAPSKGMLRRQGEGSS